MEYPSWVMRMNDSLRRKPKVPNNLKYYREKIGVTGQEMEWRTGITKRHWPYYESGIYEPKVSLAQRMAIAFNEIVEEKGIDLKMLTVDDLYPLNRLPQKKGSLI